MNWFYLALGLYAGGCLGTLLIFLFAPLPARLERKGSWPLVLMWPLVVLWLAYARAAHFTVWKNGREK